KLPGVPRRSAVPLERRCRRTYGAPDDRRRRTVPHRTSDTAGARRVPAGIPIGGSVPEHESPDRADADASPAERVTHRTSAAVGGCRRGRRPALGPQPPRPPFKGRTGGFGEVSLGRTLTGEEDLPAMQLLDYAGFRDRLAQARSEERRVGKECRYRWRPKLATE